MNFFGKKVLVLGLGRHGGGVGVTKWLLAQGARVTVTDLRSRKELAPSLRALKGAKLFNPEAKLPMGSLASGQYPARSLASGSTCFAPAQSRRFASLRFVLGHHSRRDILKADLIVQNPGVPNDSPFLKLARRHHIPITNDTALFFEHCPWPIIGVTGTKGKTTTATLLYEILRRYRRNVFLAGNLRISPLELLLKITPPAPLSVRGERRRVPPPYGKSDQRELPIIVLELSSWNLEGLARIKQSPHVAVITNIMPDHLNRYPSMREYIEAKAQIFKYQKPGDILVLNRDNPITRSFSKRAKGRVVWFSRKTVVPKRSRRATYPIENAAAAAATVRTLGVPITTIRAALRSFRGVPGRLEHLGTFRGIRYINDTTATTPEATIAALRSLAFKGSPSTSSGHDDYSLSGAERSRRVSENGLILIAGGGDKRLKYDALAHAIKQHCKALILFKGAASEKILKTLVPDQARARRRRVEGLPKVVSNFTTMPSALRAARKLAQRGDTILLSPAATSFGLFAHEFDRGDQFVRAVRRLHGRR